MNLTATISRISSAICGLLFAISFAVVQALIGGTRLLFSLPTYGVLGVIAVLSILSIRQRRPLPNQLCLLTSAVFAGYVVIRGVLSPVDYIARPDIYLVMGCLLVYLFVACFLTGAKQRTWFLFFLFGLAIAQVVIGAIQFRDGNNFMLIPFLQRADYGRRASGFYISPNHLAGLLEVLGIFGLSIACWGRWAVWLRVLVLYATSVCYVGVLLSASRGGYISCAASLIVFLVLSALALRRSGKQLFLKIAGVGLGLVVLVLIIGDVYSNKLLYMNDRTWTTDQQANDNRIDLWNAAIQQFKLEPIVGTGSGTYLFYGRQFRNPRTGSDPVEVHNDYLHLLAEYGIVGGVCFLIFFGAHLTNGWKEFQRLGPKRIAVSTRITSNSLALQIGALAAIGAYIVHSALDFNLHIPANALLIAFVLGLLANPGVSRDVEPPRPTKALIGWRLVFATLGIFVAIQSVRLLPAEYYTERARIAVRDNDPKTSVDYAIRALATEKSNPNIYLHVGRAEILEGNAEADPRKSALYFELSIAAFQKGWALARQEEIFPLEIAAIYDALGRFPEAEWMYSEATRLDPNSVKIKQIYEAHLEKWRTSPVAESGNVDVNQR